MPGPPTPPRAGRIGAPARHIPRDRLISLLRANQIAVVEAGAGFGKSALAGEFQRALEISSPLVSLGPPDNEATTMVSSIRRSFRGARLSDLAASLESDNPKTCIDALLDVLSTSEDPILLVLDDAHHVQREDTAALLCRLVGCLPLPHRVLVLARRLDPHLEPIRALPGVAVLGSDALAFTDDEARDLLRRSLDAPVTDYDVNAVVDAARGWVTALVLAAGALARPDDVAATFHPVHSGRQLLATIIQGILERLDPVERDSVIQLSHLPFFSPEVATAMSPVPDLFNRIVAAGIPLNRTGSGWWEMPGPVADYLSAKKPLASPTATAAARAYAEAGGVASALDVLLAASLTREAAAMLAGLQPDVAEDLGVGYMWELVEGLPDTDVRAEPRVLLHVARVAEAGYRSDLRGAALARAARIADDPTAGVSPALRREIDAERARDLLWQEETFGQAEVLAAAVLAAAAPAELVARARALDVLGRCRSWMSAAGPQADAEALLAESARLARRVGQQTWAAQALVPLAVGVHCATCRFERALSVLDEVLAGLPARRPYRALVETFRSDVLCEMGRFSEAAASIRTAREIGQATKTQWPLAYASWSEAVMASYAGDRQRTVDAVLDVERHRDVWYTQVSGIEFLSHAADLLDRVAVHDLALEYLERARDRMKGFERSFRVFEASVLGRSGDPVRAEEVIMAVLARPDLEPQERWPLLILRAHAARRRGDGGAGALAAEAFQTCQALGNPDGPLVRERVVSQELLPIAAAAGSTTAAAALAGAGRVSISLLGQFAVRRGGRCVEVPAGKPSQAIRAVAALGGRVQADQLIEILWPDTEVGVARNRLRNLLSRLKSGAGALLVRAGDMVALADGIDVDAGVFESEASSALGAVSTGQHLRAEALGRSALARYQGDLLPEDRYERWAEWPRERLRQKYLGLLDLLAEQAEARGEIDEAVRLLRQAADAEQYNEQRYVRLATLLASQHRMGSARTALRQAAAALTDLGVKPSPAFESLASLLATGEPDEAPNYPFG